MPFQTFGAATQNARLAVSVHVHRTERRRTSVDRRTAETASSLCLGVIIMKAKIIVTLYIKNVTRALYAVNYNKSTLSVSVNAAWNSVVLTARRNDCSEVAALTDKGRAFQARAAATGKARSPSVERRVDGTISVDVVGVRRCTAERKSTKPCA